MSSSVKLTIRLTEDGMRQLTEHELTTATSLVVRIGWLVFACYAFDTVMYFAERMAR